MWRGPLRHRQFRLLFAGQAISAVGDRLVPVVLAFAVLDLTGSVKDLGFVLAASTVPLVLFSLFGGVWADRLPRQRVMLLSDVVRGCSQTATAVLLLTGAATLAELIVLQAVYGAAAAFFEPAAYAVRPQTVPAANVQEANALMGLTTSAADIAGPALAGVLLVTAGAGWGLAFDAATFAVSVGFLSFMRLAGVAAPSASIWRDLRWGWQAFRRRTWLWTSVLFFTCFIAFVLGPLQVVGPQVARLHLGGAGAWAAINTAIGIGAVAGGLLALRWRPRHPLRVAFAFGLLSTPLLLCTIGLHAPLAVILVGALWEGSVISLFNALWFTTQHRLIPAAERWPTSALVASVRLRTAGTARIATVSTTSSAAAA